MGNTGSINPDYLRPENIGDNGDAYKAFTKKDIATTSLLTRYGPWFTALTAIFFSLLVAVLCMIIYLLIEIYNSFNEHKYAERIMSIIIPCVLAVLIILYGFYYFKYIRQELIASDKIVTDIERVVSEPMTASSLVANLTNLVAIKTGGTDRDSVRKIYENLDNQIRLGKYNDPRRQFEYANRVPGSGGLVQFSIPNAPVGSLPVSTQ